MRNKEYKGYPESNKKSPSKFNEYEVSRVLEELGKKEEDCRKCPDFPSKTNQFKPCGCMRLYQENFDGCVCAEELKND